MYNWYKEKTDNTRKWILTGFLCVIWYLVSIGKALLAKYISTLFKKPLTLSFVQLVSISLYSIPLLYFCKLKFNCITKDKFLQFLIPLSILKAITTASGHLAIWNISVSYNQIMRASMPIFTAIFCRLLLKTTQTTRSYLSLIPIVAGICITSFTEIEFSLAGMLYGMAATSGASLQTIYNKRLMEKTKIHSFQLTALLGWLSTILFFFVWFSVDGLSFIEMENKYEFEEGWWKVPSLLVLDGFTNFIQNVVAFAVLFLISPTSYAVGNISKRPIIIVTSIIVFKNAVSLLNVLGILVTVIGASLYTYFEIDEDKKQYDTMQMASTTSTILESTESLEKRIPTPTNREKEKFAKNI